MNINDFKEDGSLRKYITQTGLLDQIGSENSTLEEKELLERLKLNVTKTDVFEYDEEEPQGNDEEDVINNEEEDEGLPTIDSREEEHQGNDEEDVINNEEEDDE